MLYSGGISWSNNRGESPGNPCLYGTRVRIDGRRRTRAASPDYAWFTQDSGLSTQREPSRVGRRRPNGWGLHDMHGNLREWCADWSAEYQASDAMDPRGPEAGMSRVWRSGCWDDPFFHCRSASRSRSTPGHRDSRTGFRLALELDTEALLQRRLASLD